MISRILAFVALVSVASGGAWYVFRDTPQKRIVRWREEAKYFLEKTAELEKAEELNEKILRIIPTSAHDLVFKAAIRERRGTPQSLREALEIYDKVLESGDTNVLGVAFLKARTCRSMGLVAQAQGTLLSVVDVFPGEALMELGETSMSAFAATEALKYFTKAREIAESKRDVARAQEGIANAYLLLLSIYSPASRAGALPGELNLKGQMDPPMTLESLRASCRRALDDALSFVKSNDIPSSPEEANRRLVWATTLYEKLGSVKNQGETPFRDGIIEVDGRRKDYSIRGEETPALLVRLGALRLMAARDEASQIREKPGDYEEAAEADFLRALRISPDEAKALIVKSQEPPPEAAAQEGAAQAGDAKSTADFDKLDEYLQTLLAVSRVYLATSQLKRIFDDGSLLALSRRIADVIEPGQTGASGVFSMLAAFAHFRAGEAALGERLTDAYLGGLPADAKPRATIEIAEQALRLLPDDPLALKLFDRFEAVGGKPLELIGKRIGFLVAARARSGGSSEASRRIDEILRKAIETLQGPSEFAGVSKILYYLKGREAAVDILRAAVARYPDDRSIRRVFSDLLFEKAGEQGVAAPDKITALREALGGYLKLFIQSPGESQDVTRRAVEAVKKIEEERGDAGIARELKPLFPLASAGALDTFASAIRAFCLAQFGPALDRASAITETQSFNPFLSFLKGSCHIGLATYLQRDASRANSDVAKESLTTQYREHVQKAMDELRQEPGFISSRLELANLEFQRLPDEDDVPEDLLKRIQELSESEGLEQSGHFLLARALHRRFEHRYEQKKVKNSELVRLLVKEQKALRSAIRKKPTFVPAYLALAETFVVADRSEKAGSEALSRQIFTPSYEKAISIVKAVPNPDEQVTSRLAQYCEAAGRLDEAAQYLEQVASVRPSVDVFSRLFASYLRKDNPCLGVFLDDQPPGAKGPFAEANLKQRLPLLLSLRSSFEQLPEYLGLRYMFRAMEAEKAETESTSDPVKKRHRQDVISAYTRSLEAFDQKNIKAPLLVINNLAWYLSEDPDSARKARALELASRGKARVPNLGDAPDVFDTYAWVLYQNGKLGESEQTLRDLIKSFDKPTYRYHLARVLFALKKLDDALAEVRRARDSPRPFREDQAARELEAEIKEARRKAVGQ